MSLETHAPARLAGKTPVQSSQPATSRRELLAYVVSGPLLTISAGAGIYLVTRAAALALPLPTTPDTWDAADLVTAGSTNARVFAASLPNLAATAPGRLTAAAARGISVSTVSVSGGMVVCADGRTATRAWLKRAAATVTPPVGVVNLRTHPRGHQNSHGNDAVCTRRRFS